MKNFVISLSENNEKRRAHIVKEFAEKKVPFKFFDAITPQDNEALLQKYGLDKVDTELSPVEISCFLSHYQLWKYMIEEDLPFIGVFEDDIYLGEDAGLFLNSTDWVSPDIHVLKLEKGWQKIVKFSFFAEKNVNNRNVYKLKSPHYGAAGYIISNNGARYLVEQYKLMEAMKPVDVVMFRLLFTNPEYKVSQLLPALCIQDFLISKSFNSALESSRSDRENLDRMRKKQVNLSSKILREMRRPFCQIKLLLDKALFVKKVIFK